MRRTNLLLISIDTLRADHVSCYGYPRPTTPNLDRLAADGTRFSRAYTTAVWTPPAHSSMLTGLFPSQHGVVDENKLSGGLTTIAQTLREAGYATFGAVNNSQVGDLVGLNRGHETFHEVWRGVRSATFFERGLRWIGRRWGEWRGLNDHGAARTNEVATAWLDARARSDRPFYMFVHYIEPHNPLGAPRPFGRRWLGDGSGAGVDRAKLARVADNPLVCYTDSLSLNEAEIERLQGMYDGEIAYVDDRIGELLDHLRRLGVYDDMLIVVTADHGEHFGEHGHWSHVSSLYEPIVHVPLIVKFPTEQTQPPLREELVQLVDIVPTLAAAADTPPPNAEKLRGRPLFARGAEGVGHDQVFAEWEGRVPFFVRKRLRELGSPSACEPFLQPCSMIRDERFKLIRKEGGPIELYDLSSDPQETTDVAATERPVAERLEATLLEWKQSVVADAPEGVGYTIDPEIQRHLESLGYM